MGIDCQSTAIEQWCQVVYKHWYYVNDDTDNALAIVEHLGIANLNEKALTGTGLDEISDDQFEKMVIEVRVYAGVTSA